MKEKIGNPVVFVICYLLFMVPTYVLPYLGSNSTLVNAAAMGKNPLFWLHLISLIILVLLAWIRGGEANKKWLIIFPILALVFDLVPALSSVPFVPTVMHLLAIILGVVGNPTAQTADRTAS